ncbi:hypothetical protein V8E52_007561 [Russula decolorans]
MSSICSSSTERDAEDILTVHSRARSPQRRRLKNLFRRLRDLFPTMPRFRRPNHLLPRLRSLFPTRSSQYWPDQGYFFAAFQVDHWTPSPTKSAGSQSWQQGFGQSQHSPRDAVNILPLPTQENISAAPPVPPDINVARSLHSSTKKHVSKSQSSPSRIPAPPDKLHPTLSCWIKNMKKLSSLINRLKELASSAPTEHQSHLLRQVKALRATSKKQQQQFMDFLQLSEEYANEYLLDIDVYIQQQSSFLAKLEGRLEAAKELRGEATKLQMLYESGTLATMKNLRATALPRPLPEDYALFREVDSVLAEIKQCYTELYKFWTEEISHAMEAFEKRRIDRTDFERWRKFHTNLKQTIESWNGELPSGDAQTVLRNNACLSRPT